MFSTPPPPLGAPGGEGASQQVTCCEAPPPRAYQGCCTKTPMTLQPPGCLSKQWHSPLVVPSPWTSCSLRQPSWTDTDYAALPDSQLCSCIASWITSVFSSLQQWVAPDKSVFVLLKFWLIFLAIFLHISSVKENMTTSLKTKHTIVTADWYDCLLVPQGSQYCISFVYDLISILSSNPMGNILGYC